MRDTTERQSNAHSNTFASAGITKADMAFLEAQGKALPQLLRELSLLTSSRTYPEIIAPALPVNGDMLVLTADQLREVRASFSELTKNCSATTVIPAGGAATRQTQLLKMLQDKAFENVRTPNAIAQVASDQIRTLKANNRLTDDQAAQIKLLEEVKEGVRFFWEEGIRGEKYAFVPTLKRIMSNAGESLEQCINNNDIKKVARFIYEDTVDGHPGLGYGNLPKLLMELHRYESNGQTLCRTAFEEHLREAALMMHGSSEMRMHFIINPRFHDAATEAFAGFWNEPHFATYMANHGFTKDNCHVTFSHNSETTNSVAIDSATGKIARDPDTELPLLRNAGHGSVLSNLSNVEADGMWLQNVDNTLYDNRQIKAVTVLYKQALASIALQLEQKAHDYLKRLDVSEPDPLLNVDVAEFIQSELKVKILPEALSDLTEEEFTDVLIKVLNRPIVVAGFVPLEDGQRGGGPFVIRSLLSGVPVEKSSIVEQAEFEYGAKDPKFNQGEFFNPVLLFIARKNVHGEPFDLEQFCNPDRAFISEKPAFGRILNTFERPGLWNGSTEHCIQVNVALPASVFAAIKNMAGSESFLSRLHQQYYGDVTMHVDFERGVVDHETADYLNQLAPIQH